MTPHNTARKGDIAPVCLMPGDPLRARFVAENFLESPVCFNSVRGMLGYTGTYKGTRISIMGSGMGMPSIGIYSYELFSQYDVSCIIRIGSAGGYVPELKIFDVVLAEAAWSESTYAKVQSGDEDDVQYPGKEINAIIEETAREDNIPVVKALLHSSDVFYAESAEPRETAMAKGAKCVEMESFALFHNAKVLGKQAACLLTISDSFVTEEFVSPEERQRSFQKMMELALDSAVAYTKKYL